MKSTNLLGAVTLGLAGALSTGVQAGVVSVDWRFAGDGLISRDTNTGLEWLDLSVTDRVSFNAVSTRLSTDLAGWRVASADEAEQLFLNLGLPVEDSFGANPAAALAIQRTVQLFGDTLADFFNSPADGHVTGFYGFVSMSLQPGFHVTKGAFVDTNGVFSSPAHDGDPGDVLLSTANRDGMANDAIAFRHIGTFLVRDAATVPEPAFAWLLGLAAGAACFARMRSVRPRNLAETP